MGSLARANDLLARKISHESRIRGPASSVFTLHHWSSGAADERCQCNAVAPRGSAGNSRSPPARFPDLRSFVRYTLWRWYTRVNVLELALVALLAGCCLYQCYELLEDYYTYPTGIIVKNELNDNFRVDLPGVTLCDNNRISKATLKRNFPYLNETHFLAMAQGTFYSANNFTVANESSTLGASRLDWLNEVPAQANGTKVALIDQLGLSELLGADASQPRANQSWPGPGPSETALSDEQQPDAISARGEIHWGRVLQYITQNKPARLHLLAPQTSIIDSLVCANIFGDVIACDELAQVPSVQEASRCTTLFHDSALWDSQGDARVRELEREIDRHPVQIRFGADELEGVEYLEFDRELEERLRAQTEHQRILHESRLRVSMDNMEVIRMRIDFRAEDYGNPRGLLGARLAIHTSSVVGESTHKVYKIEPGNWYTYYIDRLDYRRLPPPYSTQCYDYDQNRAVWSERVRWLRAAREHIQRLIRRQAREAQPIAEYVKSLLFRAMGKRECVTMCVHELAAVTCNCWFSGAAYVPFASMPTNIVDHNGTLAWCRPERLMAVRQELNLSLETVGDDLFFQICARTHTSKCADSCPSECYHSSFEVIQQSRSWPSHESRRYFEDKRVWPRLKQEAECCATISIVYATPTSTSLMDEPKYTRQDMLTIISGNIEAWLGLSTVYAYLFLEHVYDSLLGAQLIGNRRAYESDEGSQTSRGEDEEYAAAREQERRWLSHYLSAVNLWGSDCFDVLLSRLVALAAADRIPPASKGAERPLKRTGWC